MCEQDGMYTYKCTCTHLQNTITLNFSKKYELQNYLYFGSGNTRKECILKIAEYDSLKRFFMPKGQHP